MDVDSRPRAGPAASRRPVGDRPLPPVSGPAACCTAMSCQIQLWPGGPGAGHDVPVIVVIARVRPHVAELLEHEFRDLVSIAAAPDDGLEHLYVAIGDDVTELVFFMAQPTVRAAEVAVKRLCDQALSKSEKLRGCRLDERLVGLSPGIDFTLHRDPSGRVRVLPPQEPDSSDN